MIYDPDDSEELYKAVKILETRLNMIEIQSKINDIEAYLSKSGEARIHMTYPDDIEKLRKTIITLKVKLNIIRLQFKINNVEAYLPKSGEARIRMTYDPDDIEKLHNAVKMLKLILYMIALCFKINNTKAFLSKPGEARIRMTYPDDIEKLHNAVKMLKLDLNTIAPYPKILAAKGFQPKPGEPPDKNGNYWRKTKTNKPYPIRIGEDPGQASKKAIDSIEETKSQKKPFMISKNHTQAISTITSKLMEQFRLQEWDGENTVDIPSMQMMKGDALKFFKNLVNEYGHKIASIYASEARHAKEEKTPIYEGSSQHYKTASDTVLKKYPKLKKLVAEEYKVYNSFIEHYLSILESRPPLYRGTTSGELKNMSNNNKIGGTRDGAAYFTLDFETAKNYAKNSERDGQGDMVVLELNTKKIDLIEHLGIYNKLENTAITIMSIAINYGVPLQRQKIPVTKNNLTIHLKKYNDKRDNERLKKFSKIGKVKFIGS